MKKALIFWGGWNGHEPEQVAHYIASCIQSQGIDPTVTSDLSCLDDRDYVASFHLIVPVITMSELSSERTTTISEAVAGGCGLLGFHGGMCDAFRDNVLWQFITGGNWVAHPGGDGVHYTINIKNSSSPLIEGIDDFDVISEQYYLHVDPCVEVLATTRFPVVHWYHSANGAVDIPQLWTKRWGHGRVWYNALGHVESILRLPEVTELMKRGIAWTVEGRDIALEHGLKAEDFKNDATMF